MEKRLMSPKEVSAELGIDISTISKCVSKGAPVQRIGPTGFRYLIDLDAFLHWMNTETKYAKRRAVMAPQKAVSLDQIKKDLRDCL